MEISLEQHPTCGSVPQCVYSLPQYFVWFHYTYPTLSSGHPVNKFVPSDVPIEIVGLMGAATDWYVPAFLDMFRALCLIYFITIGSTV